VGAVERIRGGDLDRGDDASILLGCILVVDDDPLLLRAIGRMLRPHARELCLARDAESAHPVLEQGVDLLITDIRLGAGASGVVLAESASALTAPPPVVAMTGQADASEGLALGRVGVGVLLLKPFGRDELFGAIAQVQRAPSTFVSVVQRTVGKRPMPDVLHSVRRTMVLEALTRTGGNRSLAAKMLGISRQNLQKILSRGQVEEPRTRRRRSKA
jgi:DNA-binding NtrC family response regulator